MTISVVPGRFLPPLITNTCQVYTLLRQLPLSPSRPTAVGPLDWPLYVLEGTVALFCLGECGSGSEEGQGGRVAKSMDGHLPASHPFVERLA